MKNQIKYINDIKKFKVIKNEINCQELSNITKNEFDIVKKDILNVNKYFKQYKRILFITEHKPIIDNGTYQLIIKLMNSYLKNKHNVYGIFFV